MGRAVDSSVESIAAVVRQANSFMDRGLHQKAAQAFLSGAQALTEFDHLRGQPQAISLMMEHAAKNFEKLTGQEGSVSLCYDLAAAYAEPGSSVQEIFRARSKEFGLRANTDSIMLGKETPAPVDIGRSSHGSVVKERMRLYQPLKNLGNLSVAGAAIYGPKREQRITKLAPAPVKGTSL